MNCREIQEGIVNHLAAGGDALPAALAAHLGSCGDCQAFSSKQAALLSAIDSGLRRMTNEAVPASLLPGVRARMSETQPRFAIAVYLAPAAAIAILVLLLTISFWRREAAPSPVASTGGVPAVTPNAAVSRGEVPAAGTVVPRAANRLRYPASHRARASVPQSRPPAVETPEVIVGREEAHGLVLLAKAVSERPLFGRALLQPAPARDEGADPLRPLDIPNLQMTPLNEERAHEKGPETSQ